ncbi:unnamed protein product [Caenorhabditis angaria]|uniref:U2A'/phosphoprotein 32 family A C-terminal domain-containing protein n=1 Tax=Caenorhabditis angaria TaxID=860376 RepID=A0A9P1IAQ8_9PELO|nr:unnamed protein product [Caenorhabditis angaria]
MTSMAEKYVTELRERDPATVDTIYLDNSTGGVIEGVDDKLTNLLTLSMVNCELTSFKGLPSLPAVTYIDVTNNKFGDTPAFDILVKNAPELVRLNLSSNNITSIEVLRPLKMLTKLAELDLSHNESLGLTESYRDKIFEIIPSLKSLDGLDVDGEEIEEEFDGGEAGEDSDSGDDDEEEGGPGLSYLDKSQFSDDETDDYIPEDKAEQTKEGEGDSEARGVKRNADEAGTSDEPEAKKSTSE